MDLTLNAMNKVFIVLIVMYTLSGKAVSFGQVCAEPANIYAFTFQGQPYEVVKEKKSWSDAAACAVERGGVLVQIESLEEQNAVFDAIVNGAGVPVNYTIVNDGGGVAYVWTGATDQPSESMWIWDGNNDGSGQNFWNGEGNAGAGGGSAVGLSYINWGGTSTGSPNEPDNWGGNQDGAAIALAGWPAGTTLLGVAGEWNDIGVTNELYFVIEYVTFGINNPQDHEMIIYPNPTTGRISLKVPGHHTGIENYRIINLAGDVVFSEEPKGKIVFSLDLSGFPDGFYTLNLVLTNGKEINRKIILCSGSR